MINVITDKPKRKRKLDPSIIRVGDTVKIIVPEAFDRVGYPLTKKDIIKEMPLDKLQSLHAFLSTTFDIGLDTTLFKIADVNDEEEVTDKIVDIIAGRILRKRGWGGRDRKIYTKPIPDSCVGQVCTVFSKKVVKTGKYVPGGTYQDYYSGGYDYCPAYLSDEKTNVLYQLPLVVDSNKDEWRSYELMYFERRCIEKVTYNSQTGEYE